MEDLNTSRVYTTKMTSQFFNRTEKLDASKLPYVFALGDIPDKLTELQASPTEGNSVVVNVARIGDGELKEVRIVLVDHLKRPHLVIKAQRIFPLCPENVNLTFRRDYGQLEFPPGSLASKWTPASSFELTYWGTWGSNTKDSTKATPEQTEQWELKDFMMRAYVIPHADPRLASVEIVALPVTPEEFKQLPDLEKAKAGFGYPCVFAHSGSIKPVILAPRRSSKDTPNGLPFTPILLVTEDDNEKVNGEELVEAFRKFWNGSCFPATYNVQEWRDRTKKAPISTTEVEATHKWPLVRSTPKRTPPAVEENSKGKLSSLLLRKTSASTKLVLVLPEYTVFKPFVQTICSNHWSDQTW